MRLLRIFFTVLGAILLLWAAIDYVPALLQVAGRTAKGRVTAKSIERHGTEEETDGFYTLHYAFEAGGAQQTGKATVSHGVYRATEEGAAIEVRYWARSPETNLPAGYLGQSSRGLPLLIAGAALFIVGFFFIKPTY